MFRSIIKNAVQKAVKDLSDQEIDIKIDVPTEQSFGDYSTNAVMQAFGTVKNDMPGSRSRKLAVRARNPREYAEKLVEILMKDADLIEVVEKIDIAGPGFLNFWIKRDALIAVLQLVQSQKEKYGTSKIGEGKTVVVDYSAPNIAKPFGIGHLRSTIIGQAIYNLYNALGYSVIGDNHLGDWGTQFGKLIYMIKKENVEDFDIDTLEELYVRFHTLSHEPQNTKQMEEGAREWFKKLEDGDTEAKAIWQKCVDISLNEFQRIYDILGVTIDNALGESFYSEEMKKMLEDKSVMQWTSKGEDKSTIIDLTHLGIKTPLMFLKSDGATTYATRDLATLKYRIQKWQPERIIYEVGAEQGLHFEQVFAAAREMQIVPNDVILYHTKHGLYLDTDGKKFSTRKGKTIKLEDVLEEAIDRAKKLGNTDSEVAKKVGIGAIKYFDLMHSVQNNVVFDWDKILNMEGNSGPYLQYTYARAQSVLNKSQIPMSNIKLGMGNLQIEPEELSVLRMLSRFNEAIEDAASTYSPHLVANYLYELAQKFNTFYNKHRILEAEDRSRDFRIALTEATGTVLQNGLHLLGIETPEKM